MRSISELNGTHRYRFGIPFKSIGLFHYLIEPRHIIISFHIAALLHFKDGLMVRTPEFQKPQNVSRLSAFKLILTSSLALALSTRGFIVRP
ncbi:hypothetical protein CEXT_392651 [Caerostris extrusa]|uniref:Uncharacterized protein n=1 Tax=Caerostris extrusa TaxID=172846 RepID=A0AAV4W6P3_CAEEX|nr:hypothetical protein CEXT_392651 [Caerostris extrusa]